jgi:uncharacterized protein YbgA (DUF1722 family)/uncharacterized protein YbbK (DUF523 family)
VDETGCAVRSWPKPRVVISRCLGFDACRYNGEIIREDIVKQLEPHVEFVSVCPELEIGLGVPRDPVRIVSAGGGLRLVQPRSGVDLSERMNRFSATFLSQVGEVDGFLLKTRSPSCGIGDVKIYRTTERAAAIGKAEGFFGGAVLERFGDLAIEDEGRLKNRRIREHFLTKLFALARWRQVRAAGKMAGLVGFHAAHKLLLMAYSEKDMRVLGRIVANAENRPPAALFEEYQTHFRKALAQPPKYSSSRNALMHAFGHFSDGLSAREKRHFLDVLEKFRQHRAPLSSPLSILRAWVIRFESRYLEEQTLFEPFPEALVDLQDSGKAPAR